MSETVNNDFTLGIGIALRDARVARNLSLAEVSALLRIREAHLEAIELEDFEQLPGNVYTIGFIRTYAQYLELNESDLILRFKAASAESGIADMVFEEEEDTEQKDYFFYHFCLHYSLILFCFFIHLPYGTDLFFSNQ